MKQSGNSSSKKRPADTSSSQELISSSTTTKEEDGGWVMTKQGEDMVFTRKDLSPDQPGNHFTVPLSTLEALKTGQVIPTGIPDCFLLKTSSSFQFLRKVIRSF